MILPAAVVTICLALPSIALATPFQNGGFEESAVDPGNGTWLPAGDQSISGWTVMPNNIDYLGKAVSSSEGRRCVDLIGYDKMGGIRQSFDTVPGASYLLTFAMAGDPSGPPSIKLMTVSVGPETRTFVFDTTGNTIHSLGWATHELRFVASEPSTTLSFTSDTTGQGCCHGPMLDNVRLVQIAPPKSSSIPWKHLLPCGLLLILALQVYLHRKVRNPTPS